MAVGSIGEFLLPYDECSTFMSTDAGITWHMIDDDANMYEFGDQGSLLLLADDEEATGKVSYSWDYGKTWLVTISAD